MVLVKVKQGALEGEELELVTGDGKYYSFKGIPYAKPPLGNLRFKAPQPPELWKGVRKALQHGQKCHQYDIFTTSICPGSEDCLYLNVYSTNLKPSNGLAPVMLWIHGGGFKSGSGDSDYYGPDFLVQQGVVLVTINYRLEVLGFLCLDTPEVPGNAGLKDQTAALRWVRDNISSFGGDPDNVTIFGESAGGASVGYHLLSPLSSGLFRRAIIMSGSPLCDWATTFEPKSRALMIARQLGATTDDPQKVLEFLQTVPIEKLINLDPTLLLLETQGQVINSMYFSPVIEKEFGIDQQFLTRLPLESLKCGDFHNADVMIGYTSEEGLIFGKALQAQLTNIEQYIECLLPREVALNLTVAKAFEEAKKIRQYYFGNKTISEDSMADLVRLYSFSVFKYNINRLLRYLSKSNSSSYFYKFSCISERNVYEQLFSGDAKKKGVCHLDDLTYLFDQPVLKLPLDKESKGFKMIQQATKLWTNFAKHGNPTPDASLGMKWLPYTAEKEEYLDIDEHLTPATRLDGEDIKFWDSIYATFNE